MTSSVIGQGSLVPAASPGFADIVGFGHTGVIILRNNFNRQPYLAINDFGYNQGWQPDLHVRLLCDMTGSEDASIVGFGDDGVSISFNNGDNSFSHPPVLVIPNFGYKPEAGGWRVGKHIRFAADIRNVGQCDIIGFGDKGVSVSQNMGGSTFSNPELILDAFGYNHGWRVDEHLRFLAPVTSNGLLDIVGFGSHSISVAYNNGNGTFTAPETILNHFTVKQGYYNNVNPRFLADVMDNGWVDIIGCGDDGVYVSMNDGKGNFGIPQRVVEDFGTKHGWEAYHPRFIADLRATGRGDIIGFGEAGVYVSFNNGDSSFQPAILILKDFGTRQGWGEENPRSVADLNGDGCADIIGFGKDHVWVSFNDCNGGFGALEALTETFAFNDGDWRVEDTVELAKYR